MLAFRNDMLKLAEKYPGIVKVVVDGVTVLDLDIEDMTI